MKDLIARLERATGPDRRLDFDIWCEVTKPGGFPALSKPEESRTLWFEAWKDRGGFPRYTSSIDAALTLVPENADWALEPDSAWVRWMGKDDVEEAQCVLFGRSGKYTAIALCIAALKARSAA